MGGGGRGGDKGQYTCNFVDEEPQAAQTRRIENYKDLYEKPDNKLKTIFYMQNNKKAVLYCPGDFLAFCVVICLD